MPNSYTISVTSDDIANAPRLKAKLAGGVPVDYTLSPVSPIDLALRAALPSSPATDWRASLDLGLEYSTDTSSPVADTLWPGLGLKDQYQQRTDGSGNPVMLPSPAATQLAAWLAEPTTPQTVAVNIGSAAVVGTLSQFTTQLAPGGRIAFGGDSSDTPYTILSIADATHLTLTSAYNPPATSVDPQAANLSASPLITVDGGGNRSTPFPPFPLPVSAMTPFSFSLTF